MLLDSRENRAIVDFMRAFGIILVICFHVVAGIASLLDGAAFERHIAAMPMVLNRSWQALGSELVFLFSGFLLSYLPLRELLNHNRRSLRRYFICRFSRIVPLYVLGILLNSFVTDFTVTV